MREGREIGKEEARERGSEGARGGLIDQTNERFTNGQYKYSDPMKFGNWEKVDKDGYCGVCIENPALNNMWALAAWDVPTIVVYK